MKPKVYIETTIPSYLTARRSRDHLAAAHQELTDEWWTQHRHRFDLFASVLVVDEARKGDPQAAARRLAVLQGLTILNLTLEAVDLANRFLAADLIPASSAEDAFHIAVAAVHGMDYLLTWNCRHIANAEIMGRLSAVAKEHGFQLPTLCTPDQLMGN